MSDFRDLAGRFRANANGSEGSGRLQTQCRGYLNSAWTFWRDAPARALTHIKKPDY